MSDPRSRIAALLDGDVLEVGPGSQPFPTAAGARVVYADRSVSGGRDEVFPELRGVPRGPDATYDVDLDSGGLAGVPDDSVDAAVASHVLEHLADPVGALLELDRVVRPGGRLVLVMPDRTVTFDAPRDPTPLGHLLDEHAAGVSEVSEEHIREFCAAIHGQPRLDIHTDEVWEWHDPERLDEERLALHRTRSIHVHCWRPEEFAVLLAGVASATGRAWSLDDAFVLEDVDGPGIEFGIVLRTGGGTAQGLVEDYARFLARPPRDPARLLALHRALSRDGERAGLAADLPLDLLAEAVREERRDAARSREQAQTQLAAAQTRLAEAQALTQEVLGSRTYRAGAALTTPLRVARRLRATRA